MDYLDRLVRGMRPDRIVVFEKCNVTHWWKLRLADEKTLLYVGTPETFDHWKKEQTQ